MRRSVAGLLVVAAGLIGCWGNNPATNTDSVNGPHPKRSTLGVVSPSPKPSHAASASSAAVDPGVSPSPAPTLKPPPLGIEDSLPPLPPGQAGFSLGAEAEGSWGLGPYLVRPRMALVAGATANAIIVAEGEHRASLETYDPDKSGGWLLDNRHDPDPFPEADDQKRAHDHGGGLMWATGGIYKNELWTAGGFDGQLKANENTGVANVFLYREVEGFSHGRTATDGVRTLNVPVRAAAGGVIGTNLYVAGGFNQDAVVGLPDGTYLNPSARTETQKVDIDKHADTANVAAMPKGVAGAASVVLNGHLIVLGGYTIDNQGVTHTVADVQEYDPTANKWIASGDKSATVPPLPTPLHSSAAAVIGHTVYLVGGMGDDGKVVGTMYVYDYNNPAGTWIELPHMPTARAMLALVPFKDALWAIGGIGADGQPQRTVEKYYTEVPSP